MSAQRGAPGAAAAPQIQVVLVLLRLGRPFTVYFPGDPELIDQRTVAARPEGFLQRHRDSSVLCQFGENPFGGRGILAPEHDRETLWLLVRVPRHVSPAPTEAWSLYVG